VWVTQGYCFLMQVKECIIIALHDSDTVTFITSRLEIPVTAVFLVQSNSVVEAYHTLEPTQSFFGLFRVPSRLLPFLLLVLIQVHSGRYNYLSLPSLTTISEVLTIIFIYLECSAIIPPDGSRFWFLTCL
jgi:hypothetical protein